MTFKLIKVNNDWLLLGIKKHDHTYRIELVQSDDNYDTAMKAKKLNEFIFSMSKQELIKLRKALP
jgi:hypothetical protein